MDLRPHHYVLEDEVEEAMRNQAAAELLLPDVIDNTPPSAWAALVTQGNAKLAADVKEDTEAGRAGGITDEEVLKLQAMSTSIRNIGKAVFEHEDDTLFDRFNAVPADARTDLDVVSQATKIDAVWALVPLDAETETPWVPKKDLTRTAYQAQIAKVQEKVGIQTGEATEASAESSSRNQMAVMLHRKNKRWRTVALNSYEKYSPQWEIVQRTIMHKHPGPDSGMPQIPPRDTPA